MTAYCLLRDTGLDLKGHFSPTLCWERQGQKHCVNPLIRALILFMREETSRSNQLLKSHSLTLLHWRLNSNTNFGRNKFKPQQH
jgi:hypothetical protein